MTLIVVVMFVVWKPYAKMGRKLPS